MDAPHKKRNYPTGYSHRKKRMAELNANRIHNSTPAKQKYDTYKVSGVTVVRTAPHKTYGRRLPPNQPTNPASPAYRGSYEAKLLKAYGLTSMKELKKVMGW